MKKKSPHSREDEGNSHMFDLEVIAQCSPESLSDTTVEKHEYKF